MLVRMQELQRVCSLLAKQDACCYFDFHTPMPLALHGTHNTVRATVTRLVCEYARPCSHVEARMTAAFSGIQGLIRMQNNVDRASEDFSLATGQLNIPD